MPDPFVARPRAVSAASTRSARPASPASVPGAAFVPAVRAASDAAAGPAVADTAAVPMVPAVADTAAVSMVAALAADGDGGNGVRPPELALLAPYLDDPAVTDVFINGEAGLFVDRGNGAVRVTRWRAGEEDVRRLAVRLIGLGGRHIDDATPCVDVRLTGDIRVHAVLPPVARAGTTISMRVPRARTLEMADLERGGMFDAAGRVRLERLIGDRENLLISGAAGSGKTTLLSALMSCVPAGERIVTIEDVAELRPIHPHHVSLQTRQPNAEGAGAVGLAQLVREALRMRPDRLVVGECRGGEVRELLMALNTGHDGGAGTVHANGLDDVPARLEALGALADLSERALARQVVSAIGCVVHLARAGGRRIVAGIGRPVLEDGRLIMRGLPWG